jgi:glycosyltransferase involved in cell wall biosynthesis
MLWALSYVFGCRSLSSKPFLIDNIIVSLDTMHNAMRITYITAGAGGMFCGSCFHDNTLVATLIAQGHDALLVPTYTPIRTDEPDVSQKRIFFGGVNVFLEQHVPLFRHTPRAIDRLFNSRRLLRWAGRFAAKTRAEDLGDLTVSVLKGEHGYQAKEVTKLVDWLESEIRPEIVNLTNVLLSGLVHELKRRLKVPVLATLQGDDVFLEALPEAPREQAMQLIRDHCREIDGFIATSAYYADFMADYLSIPRGKIHVVYPGLNLDGHSLLSGPRESSEPTGGNLASATRPLTIGYFARICPEKGLHVLADAFLILKKMSDTPACRLRVSGWLGENQRPFLDDIRHRLKRNGLEDSFEHVESPDHASKVQFLQSLDVLSVPTTYREPKGLYVLEALANGIPVVQPRHGSFPELIEKTGGGLLVNPSDPEDLAQGLKQLLTDHKLRDSLGRKGKEAVHRDHSAAMMAEQTLEVYGKYRHA